MSKGIKTLFLVMIISLAIAGLWNTLPIIKESVHVVLDPTAGALLDYNVNLGMVIIAGLISLGITLVQKYTTDQETLKDIRKEQKILQKEMKKYKENPEKILELQKKQFEFIPKTMDITMRPLMYTAIPIILFFRWFNDYFSLTEVKIFGFLSWFLAYLIFAIIFSMIFKKIMNVY